MSFYLKDPDSRIDYAIEWGASYLDGRAMTASTWSVFPVETGGIVVEAASFHLARTTATLSGGIAGHVYSLVNRITLSDERVDERSITLRVEDR